MPHGLGGRGGGARSPRRVGHGRPRPGVSNKSTPQRDGSPGEEALPVGLRRRRAPAGRRGAPGRQRRPSGGASDVDMHHVRSWSATTSSTVPGRPSRRHRTRGAGGPVGPPGSTGTSRGVRVRVPLRGTAVQGRGRSRPPPPCRYAATAKARRALRRAVRPTSSHLRHVFERSTTPAV
jgi:hypothetical protein